jgi:hypothetical protein
MAKMPKNYLTVCDDCEKVRSNTEMVGGICKYCKNNKITVRPKKYGRAAVSFPVKLPFPNRR